MRPIDLYDTTHKPAKYLWTGWFANRPEAITEGSNHFRIHETCLKAKTALPFKTLS